MCKEDFAAVVLSRVSGIGPVIYRQIIEHFGSAEAAFRASIRDLIRVPGVSEKMARELNRSELRREAELILNFTGKHDVDILRAGSPTYPVSLSKFDRAPAILYHKGKTDFSNRRTLAVVGTRRISDEAGRQIERLLAPLVEYHPLIISGLAYGVDTAAHRRALALGLPTLAVLGSGLQHVYPYSNRKLAADLGERGGGVLTAYPQWVKPEREHFPARNRIVAMLAEMTLVVESDVSGGSIITANMAHEYGRKVGACPGRGGDGNTAGCNALIKQGKAYLVDRSEDIVRLLDWQPAAEGRKQLQLFLSLPPQERRMVELLQREDAGLTIDELTAGMDLPPAGVAGLLLNLEIQGVIAALPGQRYRLVASGPMPAAP